MKRSRPLALALAVLWLPAPAQAPPVPAEIQEALKRLRDPDPKVRAKAAWVLGDQGKDAVPVIDELIAAFADPKLAVKASMADAFGQMGPKAKKAVPALLNGLKDEDPHVRRRVVNALGLIKSEAKIVVPALIEAISDPDAGNDLAKVYVPQAAIRALGNFGSEAKPVVPHLLKILHDPHIQWRFVVVSPLGKIGDPQVVPHLLKYMNDKTDIFLRGGIARSLANFGPKAKDAIPHLIVMVKMEGQDQRIESAKGGALIALGKMGSEATRESVEVLIHVLRDKKSPNYLREQAARSLGQLGPKVAKDAIPALVETLVRPRISSTVLIDSLAAMGKDAVPELIPFVKRENQRKFKVRDTVREQILAIFEKMGPQAKEALSVVNELRSERNPIGPAAERALDSILGLREPEKK